MELTWQGAVIAVGLEKGMVDETGRALTDWSRRLLDKGKRRHARARRDHLQYMKAYENLRMHLRVDANSESATLPSQAAPLQEEL
jgi:hypothetical protein